MIQNVFEKNKLKPQTRFACAHDRAVSVFWRACSYGLYSYGLCSYGLCSYDLYSYGLYSYGLYSYGL